MNRTRHLPSGDRLVIRIPFLDRDSWPDVFIVLAAAGAGPRPSISTWNIDTPLGTVAVDRY